MDISSFEPLPLFRADWTAEEYDAAHAAVEGGPFAQPDPVAGLEGYLKDHYGSGDALALNSATSALLLALIVSIPKSSKVLVPDIAFPAAMNAVVRAGHEPVLVGVDDDTFTTSHPLAAEATCDPAVRGAIALHLYGAVDVNHVVAAELDRREGVVVGDAAHVALDKDAVGTTAVTALSYYPTKPIAGFDGGVLLADADRATAARRLARHGMVFDWASGTPGFAASYDTVDFGYKLSMNVVSAAVVKAQYHRADQLTAARSDRVRLYATHLREVACRPTFGTWDDPPPGLYALPVVFETIKEAEAVADRLRQEGVNVGHCYPPLSRSTAGRAFTTIGDPNATEALSRRLLLLPVHPGVPLTGVEVICDHIRSTLE